MPDARRRIACSVVDKVGVNLDITVRQRHTPQRAHSAVRNFQLGIERSGNFFWDGMVTPADARARLPALLQPIVKYLNGSQHAYLAIISPVELWRGLRLK